MAHAIVSEIGTWVGVASVVVSVVGVILVYKGNHIAKIQSEKNTPDERDLLRSNYQKISVALGIVKRDAKVNDKAMELLWKARDEARLELPKEIAEYTQSLFDRAQEHCRLQRKINGEGRLSKGPEWDEVCNRENAILGQWLDEKPYDKYSKFLKKT